MSSPKRLEPFTPSHMIWRSCLETTWDGHTWAIDANFFDWNEKITLYQDGIEVDEQSSPASFDLGNGAIIEAKMGWYGMQRLHLIADGQEQMLTPVAGSAEARRAQLARSHPTLSRMIAATSWTILVIGLVLLIPQLIELAAGILDLDFESPINLPGSVNTALSIASLLALIERGLRFKANPWLDDDSGLSWFT